MKNICSISAISNMFSLQVIINNNREVKKNYGPGPVGLDLKTKIRRTGPDE